MKRIKPLALIAVRSDEYRLRCRPDFERISEAEYAGVMRSFRARCVDRNADDKNVESEFVFTVDENGGVLQDDEFFHITNDDYGELWINRSITSFWVAARDGIKITGDAGDGIKPYILFCDLAYNDLKRLYKVQFERTDLGVKAQEFTFEVTGKGDTRQISWEHGASQATWNKKQWSFKLAPSADLEPLLISIIKMDEAIHLDLMPYAMS